MNRRGQLEGLKETLVMVLEVTVALMLLALIIWAVMLFFGHEPTAAERDLDRAYAEIESLQPKGGTPVNVKYSIPAEGSDYIMDLLPAKNNKKQCKEKACLCVQVESGTTTCKELPKAIVAASLAKDCAASLCVLQATAIGTKRAGAGIPICAVNNELRIGPLCG